MLHKGALPWLVATVSLAPVGKKEAKIVENSLDPLPQTKHFTCLLTYLCFSSQETLANPVFLQNRLMRHMEASLGLLTECHGLPLLKLLLLSLLPTGEWRATTTDTRI